MATNQYFNNYNSQPEQDLTESMIIEAIQIKGYDVNYLPKTLVNYDYLYGEDTGMAFNQSVVIEMYLAYVEGFGGGFSVDEFGSSYDDTGTLVVSKKRFIEELQGKGIDRPMEGDLIYLPLTNTYFEIKYVDDESPFFQLGKQYVWEIKCQVFDFSYESFNTGETDVDDNIDIDFDPATDTEEYGDNDELTTDTQDTTDFDPNNPFRVIDN